MKIRRVIRFKKFRFLDDVGFVVLSRPKRGISFMETFAYVTVPSVRIRNILIMVAINKYGQIYFKLHNKALKSKDFKI